MKLRAIRKLALPLMTALLAMPANPVLACAACYGRSDAPMAQGMNAGIMVLLGVIAVVLSGVAGFFVYLAKKPGLSTENPAAGAPPQPTPGA